MTMEIIDDYEYSSKDLIGHGAFAVVFKGRVCMTHEPIAIKRVNKKNLAKSRSLLAKEIKILQELSCLRHENIVALLQCKETPQYVHLIMEFCNGGDLAEYLHAQPQGTLKESVVQHFLIQVCRALKALNTKGVIHRDLKPQNLLLCYDASAGVAKGPGLAGINPLQISVKMADFGFARFLEDGVMAATLCGSPMYMAPEVIMSLTYDAKADLWSIAVIVFQCLTGRAPFEAKTPQQLKQLYERNINLRPNVPSSCSPAVRDLLVSLLKRSPKDRLDIDQTMHHPFLKCGGAAISNSQLGSISTVSPASTPSPPPTHGRSPPFDASNPSTAMAIPYQAPVFDSHRLPVACSPSTPTCVRRRSLAEIESDFEKVPGCEEPGDSVNPSTSSSSGQRHHESSSDFVLLPENVSVDTSIAGCSATTNTTGGGGSALVRSGARAPSPPSLSSTALAIQQHQASGVRCTPPPHHIDLRNTPPEVFRSHEHRRSGSVTPPEVTFEMVRSRNLSGGSYQLPPNANSDNQRCLTDAPVAYVPPELVEETLLSENHCEVVRKLSYTQALVEVIVELAQSRSGFLSDSCLLHFTRPSSTTDGTAHDEASHQDDEGTREAEQLVLYMQSLQLIKAALSHAQSEFTAQRLCSTPTVLDIVKTLQQYYRQCVVNCRDLQKARKNRCSKNNGGCQMVARSSPPPPCADQLLYAHALAISQSAALDEISQHAETTFTRYQHAQLLFHCLAERSDSPADRQLLRGYKKAVQQRLHSLESQGLVYSIKQ